MKNTVNKRLLFNFFSNKTSSFERKLIEEWLEDTENEEIYYEYLDEWESLNTQFSTDLDKAIKSYQFILDHEVERDKVRVLPYKNEFYKSVLESVWAKWSVAVSIVLITLFYFKQDIFYKTLTSPNNKTSYFILNDGSQVQLNANSSIIVPRFGFSSDARIVQLDGEADFKVRHTSSHTKFIVRMGDGHDIVVLGTQFVAFSRAKRKHVFLSEGKVKVQLPKGEEICLKPGDLFNTNELGKYEISKPENPEKFTAWMYQKIYLDNTKLSELIEIMKERYAIQIRVNDSLLNERRIGGIFHIENPIEFIESMGDLLNVEVVNQKEYIELKSQKPIN